MRKTIRRLDSASLLTFGEALGLYNPKEPDSVTYQRRMGDNSNNWLMAAGNALGIGKDTIPFARLPLPDMREVLRFNS